MRKICGEICGKKRGEKKRLDEFIKPLFAYALLRLSG